MNIAEVRGRQPQGTKFWCQQKPLVTSVICYKIKKSLWNLILYNFLHDFIHVYSPGAGADNLLTMKSWCQQEHLVTSVICCKFKNNLFEVWFYTCFFMILYMYITPGQGQTDPGDKVLMSTEMSCHFIHLLQVKKKMSLKSDLIIFFTI